jgi:ABC-type transport system involved in cytochrome c biogenesis permease component
MSKFIIKHLNKIYFHQELKICLSIHKLQTIAIIKCVIHAQLLMAINIVLHAVKVCFLQMENAKIIAIMDLLTMIILKYAKNVIPLVQIALDFTWIIV